MAGQELNIQFLTRQLIGQAKVLAGNDAAKGIEISDRYNNLRRIFQSCHRERQNLVFLPTPTSNILGKIRVLDQGRNSSL